MDERCSKNIEQSIKDRQNFEITRQFDERNSLIEGITKLAKIKCVLLFSLKDHLNLQSDPGSPVLTNGNGFVLYLLWVCNIVQSTLRTKIIELMILSCFNQGTREIRLIVQTRKIFRDSVKPLTCVVDLCFVIVWQNKLWTVVMLIRKIVSLLVAVDH